MPQEGEKFLHKKDPSLHTSDYVEHEQSRRERKGEDTSDKPPEKIEDWMSVLERTHTSHRDNPQVLERIKSSYHRQYIIDSKDIPESAYLQEQRIARNQGWGAIEITEEFKQRKAEQIIKDQKDSLDAWLNYLTSEDADAYPMWAKYWAFTSLVSLGKFEKTEDNEGKEQARFAKRDKDTVSPFPPLNAAAFALAVDAISLKVSNSNIPKDKQTFENLSKSLSDEQYKQLLSSESFSKLYARFLMEQPAYSSEGLKETRGVWKTYPRGSEPYELTKSLEGYPLEWCIRAEGTARDYLSGGDMHIYYSLNAQGEATVPRLAIRMQEEKIAEVRGIAPGQNFDPYISDIAKEKLKEFPDGPLYDKKNSDMKRLTEIEEKTKRKEPLSKEDLRFLYEIDSKIQGFGYSNDPRIKEIQNTRDIKEDLASIFDTTKDKISTTKEEALKEGIVYHYGYLNLGSLTSAEGLTLPQSIGGSLSLESLTSAEGLTLPQSIGGYLYLEGLTSAEGLTLPQSIGGSLNLRSLTSAEGLTLPQSIGGSLNLRSLTSAEGLTLSQSIGGSLNLGSLTFAEGLKLPQSIGGYLDLESLTSAEGLKLPQSIGGYLDLRSLTSAEGLTLPQSIGGYLNLRSLTSAEGLTLPQSIGGYLDLRSLTSAEGLTLPQSIGGYLNLRSLTSAEGLKLPQSIGGYLDLEGLTSAEGLTLPQSIGGDLYLEGLTSADKEMLRDKYPQFRDKI